MTIHDFGGWFCVYRPELRAFELHDRAGMDNREAIETPPDRRTLLSTEAVSAILEATKDTSWATKIVETSWTKELTRRHLDIIDTLVGKREPRP